MGDRGLIVRKAHNPHRLSDWTTVLSSGIFWQLPSVKQPQREAECSLPPCAWFRMRLSCASIPLHVCTVLCMLTFWHRNFLHFIQINHQSDATIFQFIILTFVYSSTCFGRFPAHHQELNDCNGSLWFYLRIVVIVALCSWSGRPGHEHSTNEKLLHQVGDLFELYDVARTYKP